MSQSDITEPIASSSTVHEAPVLSETSVAPGPSKKALKKAAKEARFQAAKLERRAREKEAKKEKKRIIAEKRAAGELDEDEEEQKRSAKRRKLDFGGRVVVDLGFDDKMNPKEVKSLCSQLAYTYSTNRLANFPFSLIFSSLNGRTMERLDTIGDASYKRWSKSEWWSESFERLWANSLATASSSEIPSGMSPSDGSSHPLPDTISTGPAGYRSTAEELRQKVVYLTADCDEELKELKPDEIYIIGGIVDHNRYKNLCLNKAKELGVRTAKLPIGSYLSHLPTRKVLTVNQCFEILVKWVETKDWEEALYSVIPKRKFQTSEKGSTGVTVVTSEVVEEEEDEKEEEEEGLDQVNAPVQLMDQKDTADGTESTPATQ